MAILIQKPFPLLCLIGPTASGKTSLALAIADSLTSRGHKAAIVNYDAVQLYQELPILAGNPTAAEQAKHPHYLYGLLRADQPSSVAWWSEQCCAIVHALWAEKTLPILVGGTGMYVQGLLMGLSPIPPISLAIRSEVRDSVSIKGISALHGELATYDPQMAARLPKGDRQRILRAIEVYRETGCPLSTWQAMKRQPPLPEAETLILKICPPRELVYAEASTRFQDACRHGALQEVAALMAQYPNGEQLHVKALGFEEIRRYHLKQLDMHAMLEEGARQIRHYAKRQFTWCRHQFSDAIIVTEADTAKRRQIVLECVEDWWYHCPPAQPSAE
jgi:tRNA dimethylallyltransferase